MRLNIPAKKSCQQHNATDQSQQHDDSEPAMPPGIYQFQQEVGEYDQHQQVKKE